MPYALKDAGLKKTTALPSGAAATSSVGIDLGNGTKGDFVADHECTLTAPALGVTPLPNAKTMLYQLEDSLDNSSFTVVAGYRELARQLGAGGVGDTAKSAVFRLPSTIRRYVRVTATGSASGDASASTFDFEIKF